MANRSDLPALRDQRDALELRRLQIIDARLDALADADRDRVFALNRELQQVNGSLGAILTTIRLLEGIPTENNPPDPTVPPEPTPETAVQVVQVAPQEDIGINQQVLGTAGIPNSELIGPLAPAVDPAPVLDAQNQTVTDITRDADGNITNFEVRSVPLATLEPGRVSFTVGEDDPVVPPVFNDADDPTIDRPFSTADDQSAIDLDAQNAQQNLVGVTAVPQTVVDDPTVPVDLDEQNAGLNLEGTEAASVNGLANATKIQASVVETKQPLSNGDWRYRLAIPPGANYLYGDSSNQLLSPLLATQGLLFPYTPRIDVSYLAEYTKYQPTHSNYYNYFYQGSGVGEINVTAEFTAQDTEEANYLLAAITFLKAASKMFYGQDAQRGSPPPLLQFSGLGQYQFNQHPVVISQFNYNLPDDVDYIRAQANQISSSKDLQGRLPRSASSGPSWAGSTIRLLLNNLTQGANSTLQTGPTSPVRANNQQPTYVPTKIQINFQLLPVVSRQQVSNEFSVKEYANGRLLRGGFW